MSQKHEISCWKCHEMTSLETRNEFDGCCWACGEEIDLDDYLIKAMDKRDEHYAALSAVTAERDRLREENETLESQERYREQERLVAVEEADQLRAEVETWRAAAHWSALRMSGMLASAQYSMTPETTHEVLELHHHVLAGTPEKIEWLAAMAAKEA